MRLFVPTLFRLSLSSAKNGGSAHKTEKTTISEATQETSKKQTGGGEVKLDAQDNQNKSTDHIDANAKKSGPIEGSSNTAQKIEHQIEDVAKDAIDYKTKK
jgi:hypothetical protein